MYDTSDIRKGLKVLMDGNPYTVVEFQFAAQCHSEDVDVVRQRRTDIAYDDCHMVESPHESLSFNHFG